jgi:hypothetical protein
MSPTTSGHDRLQDLGESPKMPLQFLEVWRAFLEKINLFVAEILLMERSHIAILFEL